MWYGLAESLTFPSGEVISSFKWSLPAFPRVEEGGCGSAPCELPPQLRLWCSLRMRAPFHSGQLGAGWAKPVDTAAQDAGMGQVLPESVWRICAALVAGGSALLPRLLHTGKEYTMKDLKICCRRFSMGIYICQRRPTLFSCRLFWLQFPLSPSDFWHGCALYSTWYRKRRNA